MTFFIYYLFYYSFFEFRVSSLPPPQIHGAVPGAMEAFLAIRGSRTLAMRLEKAQENALILAKRLENHPKVLKVRYPGLPSHPQYEIAKKLFDRGKEIE